GFVAVVLVCLSVAFGGVFFCAFALAAIALCGWVVAACRTIAGWTIGASVTVAGGVVVVGTEATGVDAVEWWRTWVLRGCSTSTAPAVTSAAAARPATALVAIAPTLADRNPVLGVPIKAAGPAAAVDPTAAARPAALGPDAPCPA